MLYKNRRIKQIIFSNQSENDDIPEEPKSLRFAPFKFYHFYFSFLINIIDMDSSFPVPGFSSFFTSIPNFHRESNYCFYNIINTSVSGDHNSGHVIRT